MTDSPEVSEKMTKIVEILEVANWYEAQVGRNFNSPRILEPRAELLSAIAHLEARNTALERAIEEIHDIARFVGIPVGAATRLQGVLKMLTPAMKPTPETPK